MEKRLIIAIALSVLIIMGFQFLAPKKSVPTVKSESARSELAQADVAPVPRSVPDAVIEKDYTVDEKLDMIETGKYVITFSNIGGAIKKIELIDYKDRDTDGELALVDLADPRDYICALSGNIGAGSLSGVAFAKIRENNIISYYAKVGDVEIIKRYTIDFDQYQIIHDLVLKNKSGSAVAVSFRMNGGAGLSEKHAQDKRFVEVTTKIGDKVTGFKRPREGRVTVPGNVKWVAAKNKYFSIVLKPFGETSGSYYYESKDGFFVDGVMYNEVSLPGRNYLEYGSQIYAGPASSKGMEAYGEGYEESINYGFFGIIAHALMAAARMIHKVVGNWGVSIIILSVLLNILLFPLSMKSFSSMKKMHELHPQMEKLKVQLKDNPQKLNQEIMGMYKKYKVNPFGGCLPLLLQMPIFISLYQALSRSIELRGASFLWIRDLSMPDAVPIPITLPIIGNSVNILPLLMVVGMVLQQRMSTKVMGSAVTDEQKQQQKMMLIIMPVMFGFIFYNMPSGLVLYWLVNTVLTTFEQAVVFKNA